MWKMMDRLLPHNITWTPYEDHPNVCPFDDIALYSVGSGVGPPGSDICLSGCCGSLATCRPF
ncbi:hypothetical protein A2U01_0109400, partial [Trifolium medium]|nr:hypothetical protein [Trifolium medium]